MFAKLLDVCRDRRVRHLQNLRDAPVIHLNLKHLRVRIAFRKFEDVLEVRSAPRVNRLRIVTHHHHVPVIASEQIDEVSLDFVRVLIFINENKLELTPIKFRDAFVLLKHRQRLLEQVVEIHRVGRLLLPFITGMHVLDLVE